ncbi:hypothetical protein D3C85_15830 [compost metagenome]
MSINAKNAIIAGLGAIIIIGGWHAWKKQKANAEDMARVKEQVATMIKEVPEFHKPSR